MKPTCTPGPAASALGTPIEPEEIVQLLLKEVTENIVTKHLRSIDPSYNGDPGMHDRGWKEVVYSALEGLVRKHGGRAIFTRTKKKEREFMLDFVGLDDKDKNQAFRRAILGVECEWWKTSGGREELLRNFRKLLFFKAPLKLLVYGDCPAKCRAEVRETLRDSLRKFERHVNGECYLLIEFYKENRKESRFYKQEGRVWCAEQDGPAPEATFRNVGEIGSGTVTVSGAAAPALNKSS